MKPGASVLRGKRTHLHLWLAILLIAAMGLVLGLLKGHRLSHAVLVYIFM